MTAAWKQCAVLAVLAVVSMALAPHLCAMEASWVIGVEQVVGGCIFALVDLSVGNGDERRRCVAWCFVAVSVAVVRAVHPIGSAVGWILSISASSISRCRAMCALAVDRRRRSWSAVCSIYQLLRMFASILDSVNLIWSCGWYTLPYFSFVFISSVWQWQEGPCRRPTKFCALASPLTRFCLCFCALVCSKWMPSSVQLCS